VSRRDAESIVRRRRRFTPLDAADAAHVLLDLRIAVVLDAAGAGDRRVQRLRDAHDDVANAAHVDASALAREVLRLVLRGAGDRDALLGRLAREPGLERAVSTDAQQLGGESVEAHRTAARRRDAERARLQSRRGQPHRARQRDGVDVAIRDGDAHAAAAAATDQRIPPAPGLARADVQRAVAHVGADARATRRRLDAHVLCIAALEHHVGGATDAHLMERLDVAVDAGAFRGGRCSSEGPPGEGQGDHERDRQQEGQRVAGHRRSGVDPR